MGGGNLDFNLGNSSFYSLFEGRMSKSLIFSMSFHWASFELDEGKFNLDAFSDLYNYTGRSDNFTWLDWAYMGWEKDNFSVIVGKNTLSGAAWRAMITIGIYIQLLFLPFGITFNLISGR